MTTLSNKHIGFIGVGNMGYGMLKNLVNAGATVNVYDIDERARTRAAELGSVVQASPAAVAAAATTVFVCVPAGDEVREVLFGNASDTANAVASTAAIGTLIVDHSTYNRAEAVAVAQRAQAYGLRYADAPVSGMPHRAEDGTLTTMFGGTEGDFTAAKPYLDVTGGFVVHCGAVGSGQLMKAFNNVIYDINIAAICEMLPLAAKAGLDQDVLVKVATSGSARSFASEHFIPKILAGEFCGDFSLNAAYKDIHNVQETATELHAMTPVMNAMVAIYQQTIAQGLGEQPKSAMIKVYEQQLGVEFRHD